jgi:hypothetical protein
MPLTSTSSLPLVNSSVKNIASKVTASGRTVSLRLGKRSPTQLTSRRVKRPSPIPEVDEQDEFEEPVSPFAPQASLFNKICVGASICQEDIDQAQRKKRHYKLLLSGLKQAPVSDKILEKILRQLQENPILMQETVHSEENGQENIIQIAARIDDSKLMDSIRKFNFYSISLALQTAKKYNSLNIFKLFLRDPLFELLTTLDDNKNTILHYIAEMKKFDEELFKILQRDCPKLSSLRNTQGRTPQDVAEKTLSQVGHSGVFLTRIKITLFLWSTPNAVSSFLKILHKIDEITTQAYEKTATVGLTHHSTNS